MTASPGGGELPPTNWQPTRPTTTTAAIVAVGSTLGLATLTGDALVALLGVITGITLAVTVAAVGTGDHRLTVVAGGLLATLTGVGLLGSVAAALIVQVAWPPTPPYDTLAAAPFLIVGAGLSTGFGVVTVFRNLSPARDAGYTALRLLTVGFVPVVAVAVDWWQPLNSAGTKLVAARFDQLLRPTQPASDAGAVLPQFVGVVALWFVTMIVLYMAVSRLPVVELTHESNRQSVTNARDTVLGWLRLGMGVALVTEFCALVMISSSVIRAEELPPAVVDGLITVSYASLPRRLLVAGIAVGVSSLLAIRAARMLASRQFRPTYLPVAPLAVGSLLTAVVVIAHDPAATVALEQSTSDTAQRVLRDLFETVGSFALLSGIILSSLATAAVAALVVSFVHGIGLLNRHSGTQLAGSGVFLAAIAAGISDVSIPIVLVGIAASLYVLDLGEFSMTLGQEIGRAGTSRRAEIVHGAGGAVIALGTVGLGVGTLAVISSLPQLPAPPTAVAVVAAAVGTILLFLATR
ncbi:hypothetical protein C471_15892 [Halorubrum saccharovorum DSM 1137]|uniref:Uncharacterized protein n=1 Tax=Halorubrum saccharovorum DSM 1137 TaxID=1227484 RepID=M0DNK6_9EURY|nr:hypothetical protein [Halorubrum saccharovorum]ELZ36302.1 hypothetical protein C471_15892 [Halorubrum saccharovorum DSM 1137]